MKWLSLLSALKNRGRLFVRLILTLAPNGVIRLVLRWIGIYPRIVGNEIGEVKRVLISPHWNTASGGSSKHKELEGFFADFVGSKYAVAVAGGGVGILMAFRALGIRPGSAIAHQVDTCNAVPQALLNAHYTPYFVDSATQNYMLDLKALETENLSNLSGILATHLWGYPENMNELLRISRKSNIPVVEDCCLALDLLSDGKHVGNLGVAGIYSFGATKPLQVGEGGMITTNDQELAEELMAMRNWGERNNSRDLNMLGINGRFSEISSAIVIEQLKGYRRRMKVVREFTKEFQKEISNYPMFDSDQMFSDLEINASPLRLIIRFKDALTLQTDIVERYVNKLRSVGIGAFSINFEPLNTQTFFNSGDWMKWTHQVTTEVIKNNSRNFENAQFIHRRAGFSLPQNVFASKMAYIEMIKRFKSAVEELSK